MRAYTFQKLRPRRPRRHLQGGKTAWCRTAAAPPCISRRASGSMGGAGGGPVGERPQGYWEPPPSASCRLPARRAILKPHERNLFARPQVGPGRADWAFTVPHGLAPAELVNFPRMAPWWPSCAPQKAQKAASGGQESPSFRWVSPGGPFHYRFSELGGHLTGAASPKSGPLSRST